MIVKQNSNILQLLEQKRLKGHKTFLWVLQTTVVTPTTFYVIEHILLRSLVKALLILYYLLL